MEDEVSRFIPVFSSKLEAGRKLSLLKRDALVAIFKGKVEHDGLALSGLLLQLHASNGNVANHVRSRSLLLFAKGVVHPFCEGRSPTLVAGLGSSSSHHSLSLFFSDEAIGHIQRLNAISELCNFVFCTSTLFCINRYASLYHSIGKHEAVFAISRCLSRSVGRKLWQGERVSVLWRSLNGNLGRC